jgi:DNA-binding XRE family transcriptional regulator
MHSSSFSSLANHSPFTPYGVTNRVTLVTNRVTSKNTPLGSGQYVTYLPGRFLLAARQGGGRPPGQNTHISGFAHQPFLFLCAAVAFAHRRAVGLRIRGRRKQVGISQEQLAERAELSPKYLGEVERGSVNVSLDSLVRICKALAMRLGELFENL